MGNIEVLLGYLNCVYSAKTLENNKRFILKRKCETDEEYEYSIHIYYANVSSNISMCRMPIIDKNNFPIW